VISNVPAVSMVDDMSYDAQHKRLYLAGDGALDVFDRRIPTITLCWRRFEEASAQDGILVPELNRYYLAVLITRIRTPKFVYTRFSPSEYSRVTLLNRGSVAGLQCGTFTFARLSNLNDNRRTA